MQITGMMPQPRMTELGASIDFNTTKLNMALAFSHQDFCAAIRTGGQMFHLKRVSDPDPSIGFVEAGEHFHSCSEPDDVGAAAAMARRHGAALLQDGRDTSWGMSLADAQGYTLHLGQSRA